jgi:hypothetical protein
VALKGYTVGGQKYWVGPCTLAIIPMPLLLKLWDSLASYSGSVFIFRGVYTVEQKRTLDNRGATPVRKLNILARFTSSTFPLG